MTVLRTPSTLPRNQTIASSTVARRASCSASRALLLLHFAALGDVVVCADPIIVVWNGAVDDGDDAAVRRFGDETHVLAFGHAVEQFGVYFSDRVQVSLFEAMTHDLGQPGAGSDDIRRQPVHLPIAFVADEKPPGFVEHHDALCHVVQRERQQAAAAAAAAA